ERRDEIAAAVHGDVDRMFKATVTLKVKKEVAEDSDHLEKLVTQLGDVLGADGFAEAFDVEQSLTPTKAYTETSFQLPPEARAALAAAGVKQIVAMTAK